MDILFASVSDILTRLCRLCDGPAKQLASEKGAHQRNAGHQLGNTLLKSRGSATVIAPLKKDFVASARLT